MNLRSSIKEILKLGYLTFSPATCKDLAQMPAIYSPLWSSPSIFDSRTPAVPASNRPLSVLLHVWHNTSVHLTPRTPRPGTDNHLRQPRYLYQTAPKILHSHHHLTTPQGNPLPKKLTWFAVHPFTLLSAQVCTCSPFKSSHPVFKNSSSSTLSSFTHRDLTCTSPKILSLWSRNFQSNVRSSVDPNPPVAVCTMSMWVMEESSVYSVMFNVMVARLMALRRNQPTPCFAGANQPMTGEGEGWGFFERRKNKRGG